MANDGYIIVPSDSSGKKLDTTTTSVGGNEVHRERMVLGGAGSAALVEPTNAAPASDAYGIPTRNIPYGTQSVQGTVTASPSGTYSVKQVEAVTVSDGGGSLTVDGTVTAQGTITASPTGTFSVKQVEAITVSDGGGTMTVDGTVVANQGTPAAPNGAWPFRPSDGTAAYDLPRAQGTNSAFVGSGSAILAQFDDVSPINPAEDQMGIPRMTGARGVHVSHRKADGTEIGIAGSPSFVTGSMTSNVGAGTRSVAGDVAHDGVDAGNPVKIGGQAQGGAFPAAVADGDRVNALFDLVGRQLTVPWADRSNWFQGGLVKTATDSQTVLVSPGAGIQRCVTSLEMSNRSTTTNAFVTLLDSAGGTFSDYYLVSAGGGVAVSFPVPKTLSVNASMTCTMSAAANVFISVAGFNQPSTV